MIRPALLVVAASTAGLLVAAAAGAQTALPDRIAFGRLVAERNCGECHAVGAGTSPLADAPPFPQLQRRYKPGELQQLLREGMIAPARPPEEGSVPRHPRMPAAKLDDDEVSALTAYLASLDRRRQ